MGKIRNAVHTWTESGPPMWKVSRWMRAWNDHKKGEQEE